MLFFIPIKQFYLFSTRGEPDFWFTSGKIYNISCLNSLLLNYDTSTLEEKLKFLVKHGWVEEVILNDINEFVKAVILQDKECTIQE